MDLVSKEDLEDKSIKGHTLHSGGKNSDGVSNYTTKGTKLYTSSTQQKFENKNDTDTFSTSTKKTKSSPGKNRFIYGMIGAVFLTIGIGLIVAALYKDLRILIAATVAYTVAGYCIYKACKQNEEKVNFNLTHISQTEEQTVMSI